MPSPYSSSNGQQGSPNAQIQQETIDPSKQYSSYSVPQSQSSYSNSQPLEGQGEFNRVPFQEREKGVFLDRVSLIQLSPLPMLQSQVQQDLQELDSVGMVVGVKQEMR